MTKIMLDGNEVEKLVPESLPMLIHGGEGSGASLYTICLAAKWFSQGYRVLFLCGYPRAEEEFARQAGSDYKNVTFYTKEKVTEFINTVKQGLSDNTIVIVKNIELFGSNAFDAIHEIHNLLISGDIEQSAIKDKLLNMKLTTEIFFPLLMGERCLNLRNITDLS